MQDFYVNLYPLKNSAYLTSFVHPITKKKVRENFHSRTDAQAYAQNIETKFKKCRIENYQDLTIEELVVLFMREQPDKNHFVRSKQHLIDFVETFGLFKINELTTDALKVWLDQVQRENELKSITMRGLKFQIQTLFTYLEEKEIISDSPLRPIYYETYVPPVTARNILAEGEITNLLTAICSYSPGYLYPMVKLFAETAGKVNEVIELTWRDLDLNAKTVHYKAREKIQERTLTISNELVGIFAKRKRDSSLVFRTYQKESFTRTKLTVAVNEFKRTGLFKKDWGPMDLRHSYAVNFLRRGGAIQDLQRILGHNNVFDTRRLYGEIVAPMTAHNVVDVF